MDVDQEVQVMDKPPHLAGSKGGDPTDHLKDQFHRRRRKLRRLIQEAQGFPSFARLLEEDFDHIPSEEDEGDDDNQQGKHARGPKRILIDIDAELGLKGPIPDENASIKDVTTTSSDSRWIARSAPSSMAVPIASTAKTAPSSVCASLPSPPPAAAVITPADEGWYEGVVSPMSLPEDVMYLTELQQWIRQNLEIFSATDQDAALSKVGRRAPTVRGRVGVRCIHCAKMAQLVQGSAPPEGPDRPTSISPSLSSSSKIWSPGAISYPVNVAAIYSACTQKTQLHFEACPNLPDEQRMELLNLTQEANANPKRARRSGGGLPAAVYYTIAAKRIGLIDVEDGIRFGRDLALEPLPFETIRLQVENEMSQAATLPLATAPRITADEESERVLAQAITQKDDATKFLARSEDKSLVTDYIFLAIRQMAICHALPIDFISRGKKTKLMRVGFAGFCCRHCVEAGGHMPTPSSDFSCRSFSSMPDNLSSAISNSFMSHLQRCVHVPVQIKKALAAYKRIHPRQMAQLPYGSQRKLFHELWARLREADKTEEEMGDLGILNSEQQVPPEKQADTDVNEEEKVSHEVEVIAASIRESGNSSDLPISEPPPELPLLATTDRDTNGTSSTTDAIIKKFEADWDPADNDGLILPEDRHLVSDYVFLTMRQLRLAFLSDVDETRSRRIVGANRSLPGLCCTHCVGKMQMISPSGRSFPSAPDNFASALNSSLYGHMQACPYVPLDLKQALVDTRKVHSQQCAPKFGSQRKYFNFLYERLKACGASRASIDPQSNPHEAKPQGELKQDVSIMGYIKIVDHSSTSSEGMLLCTRCRMVPFHLREPGSVATVSTLDVAVRHSKECRQDSFYLGTLAAALDKAIRESFNGDWSVVDSDSFRQLIEVTVGGSSGLTEIFTERVKAYALSNRSAGQARDTLTNRLHTKGLWQQMAFKVSYNRVEEAASQALSSRLGDTGSHNLLDHVSLLDYLLLISPGLVPPARGKPDP